MMCDRRGCYRTEGLRPFVGRGLRLYRFCTDHHPHKRAPR